MDKEGTNRMIGWLLEKIEGLERSEKREGNVEVAVSAVVRSERPLRRPSPASAGPRSGRKFGLGK